MNGSHVLVLQHEPDAGPGNLADWLDAQRVGWSVVDVPTGLPQPDRYRALVVLGSRESAFDDTVEWVPRERDFVAGCMDEGTPVLGLCFGAQVLATVLGGEVSRMAVPEQGWLDIDGERRLAGRWFALHRDEIHLPAGVRILARSRSCTQAFTAGHHQGVQFHPEVTLQHIRSWVTEQAMAGQLVGGRDGARRIIAESATALPAAQRAAVELYDAFFTASHSVAHSSESAES